MEHSLGLSGVVLALAVGFGGCGKAASPVAPAAGPTTVTSTATATAAVGKEVRIEGTASDAKLSAAVVAGDLVVYCLGLGRWPDDRNDHVVVVRGVLEHTDEFSAAKDGPVSAGTSGAIYVIRSCVVE